MASSTNKTVQIVAAFVAGVALGYVVSMAPQQDDGMSGTIAPAERYRAEQPGEDSIRLGDEALAELMQSDVFIEAVSDPDISAMLADARFSALFGDADFRALFANARF